MILFSPVCTAIGNCLALPPPQKLFSHFRHAKSCIDFSLKYQRLHFPTYACFYEVCGHVFPRCLSAGKDFSPYICKLPLTTSSRLCTAASQRQAVKVLRPLLLGLIYRVHCLRVLTPLSLVLLLGASSPGEGYSRTTHGED